VKKPWLVVFALCVTTALLSCASAPSSSTVQPMVTRPATMDNKVAAATSEQPADPAHCVSGIAQPIVEDTARMYGLNNASLHYCFLRGYQGIGCGIYDPLGQGLSNRELAECDGIMRSLQDAEAAISSRKKQLDEAYDKQHGLPSAK
jgi:putative hemolysin